MGSTPSAGEPPSFFRQALRFVRSFWTDAGKQAAGNLAILIACQLISLLCQFANYSVLFKTLGGVVYGQYAVALAFYPFFYCIGSLAGGAIALRDIRLEPGRFDEIASSFLTLAAALSAILAALAFAVIPFAPLAADERWLFALVAAGAIFPCLGLSALFDAHHRQGLGACAGAVVDILSAAALFALATREALDLRAAAWLLLGRWFLTTVLQWSLFLGFVRSISFLATRSAMRRLLSASMAPTMLALIWNANIFLSIIFVVSRFGEALAGVYSIAVAIAAVAITANDMALRILSPHILGEHGLRPDFLRKLATFMTVFTFAVAVGAFGGAAVLVYGILGPAAYPLMPPLAWMLVAGVLRAFWAVNDWYLLRFHRQRISLIVMFCSAFGSSVCGWLAPAEWGLVGFPIGMLVFFSAAAIVTGLVVRRLKEAVDHSAPSPPGFTGGRGLG